MTICFLDVIIEGFEYIAIHDSCKNCRKWIDFEEDEEKICPFCGTRDVQLERGMRFVMLIDSEGETIYLQGFKDCLGPHLPKCENEDEMEEKLNEIFEGKKCNITYR